MSITEAEKEAREFLDEAGTYWERLYHIALKYMRRPEDAEDAVQDALIKAVRARTQFENKSSLYTWLVRITINTCHDMLRSKKRKNKRIVAEDPDKNLEIHELHDKRENISKKIELSDMSARLIGTIEELDSTYKDVIVLRYFESMSHREISETLEISEGTIKSRLNTARKLLKDKLKKAGIREGDLGM